MRDAILLAAGRGTRMKELTEDTPKPMLAVAGRPILEHILRELAAAGVERFVLVTGYRADKIEAHFGDGAAFGVEIRYRRQTVQDGTARALLLGRDVVGDRPCLLGWGDILTDPRNYPRLVGRFVEAGVDLLLAVNWVEDPYRGAAVSLDERNRIVSIVEKPPRGTATTHWNNAGIAVFGPALFDYAARVGKSPRGEYELPDAFTAMIRDGRAVEALPLEGLWSDVGTPEDLADVNRRLGG